MVKKCILICFFLTIFLSCNTKKSKLEEISYLSQIHIPLDSEILDYHDNLETAVVYKILLESKSEVKDFINSCNFKTLDTVNEHYFEYHDILNSFPKKEKIVGTDLKICKKYSTSIILNVERGMFWGITNYPVNLPDSVVAKKPW